MLESGLRWEMCVSCRVSTLVPVSCSWHELPAVLRVRHLFKCVFFMQDGP